MVECKLKLIYIDNDPDKSLFHSGLVAAFTLLLSRAIRKSVCVEAYINYHGLKLRLLFIGRELRGLSPQERVIRGVLESVLKRGKWPGIILEVLPHDGSTTKPENCVGPEELLDRGVCPSCIYLGEGLHHSFKPWFYAAALMVVYDELCECGDHS